MVKISIIVPCYRIEQYVRKCLDSIYQIPMPTSEFEVLCFDDYAPDNTPRILDEYATTYSNFRVIHSTVNVGPGGGRNHMLDLAQGKYVWFVDGDDSILAENVLGLLRIVLKEDLDVMVFSFQERDNKGHILPRTHVMPDSDVQRGCELANRVFPGGLVYNMGYPVRFLIKREYLLANHIRFPENMVYGEDTVWMARVVLLAQRMQSTSISAYIYWHHEDSTCGILNRAYPGRTIYERTMVTAFHLMEFAAELKERYEKSNDVIWLQHSEALLSYVRSHYVNQLPILLSRSTNKERLKYYKLSSTFEHRSEVKLFATPLTRIMMNRKIGPSASALMSVLYKLTHKKQ